MTHARWGLAAALLSLAAPVRAFELDVGLTVGGAAPLTEVLRKAGAGADLALEPSYAVLPWLRLGLRGAVGIFPQETRDADGNPKDPVLDWSISAVGTLGLVSSSDAGLLEAGGGMRGDLWLDVGVGYHRIGLESCAGLELSAGYFFRPDPAWFVGPLFRAITVFETSQGLAAYVVFGAAFGFDFGTLAADEPATAEPGAAPL